MDLSIVIKLQSNDLSLFLEIYSTLSTFYFICINFNTISVSYFLLLLMYCVFFFFVYNVSPRGWFDVSKKRDDVVVVCPHEDCYYKVLPPINNLMPRAMSSFYLDVIDTALASRVEEPCLSHFWVVRPL